MWLRSNVYNYKKRFVSRCLKEGFWGMLSVKLGFINLNLSSKKMKWKENNVKVFWTFDPSVPLLKLINGGGDHLLPWNNRIS